MNALDPSQPTAPARRLVEEVGILLVLLALAALLRVASFAPAVVDTDEGLYMVQAREWLAGGWPLVAAWDMHPIGAPALFTLAFALLGPGVEAARWLGIFCVGLTGYALHWAVRNAGAGRGVGVGAGVIYAAHSIALGGLSTNTELLIAPFVSGAMALGVLGAARAREGMAPGWPLLVGMGALIGPALLIKQVVVPEGSLAFALLTFPALFRRLLPWRRFLAMAAAYAALCAGPFLLAGLAYWSQGWLEEYLDGSLLAPFRYSLDRIAGAEAARRIGAAAFTLTWPFVAAIVATVLWQPGRRGGPVGLLTGAALLWFAVASFAIAGPGFYFAHYFLLWLPSLSLLAALGLWQITQRVAGGHLRPTYAVLTLVLAASPFTAEVARLLDRGPGFVHPDPVREVAATLQAAIQPGEPVFIANYHPSVYVLAGAGLPTRFPFPAHLTGLFAKIADTDTDEEIARILSTRPRAIVVDRGWIHTMRPEATARVEAAIAEGYELFAAVPERRGPVEIWRLP